MITAQPQSSRRGVLILVAMLLFAGLFIGAATWLGRQDRQPAFPLAAPTLSAVDAALATTQGLLVPLRERDFILLAGAERTTVLAALALLSDAAATSAALGAAADSLTGIASNPALVLKAALELRGQRNAVHNACAAATNLPVDANAAFLFATALLADAQTAAASLAAQRAVDLGPGFSQTHRVLARAATLLQDSGKAKKAWRVVLHFVPDDAEAIAGIRRFE